ncbi:N(6)-L-threonylcarbamoyladenine synthase Kae1 [Candidatus Micrarchaeota archaeon]|nr:N(6)-L-threonylcarbamoyladenine synthase Kae1 [Candidatus Micrarchaeota archaeon]
MICLGIESTAHTLGIGVVEGNKVLSNIRALYKTPKGEGIIPRKAADHHSENFERLVAEAVEKAGIRVKDVGLIAYSKGPGLGACLKVGVVAAKNLALNLNVPIVGVNHCIAHIEISKLATGFSDPLVLYVSGGNTQVIVKHDKRYHVVGETLDIGIGNLIDVFARNLGLEWAHGSVVEQLAREGKYVELPYSVKGMDLTFTGLLTHAIKKLQTTRKEDVCYSLQETAFSMCVEATERALALTRKKQVVACGGVAQNTRLQKMLQLMAEPHGAKFGVAPGEFNADNGAMIAYTGLLMQQHGMAEKQSEVKAIQKFRTDEVELW